MATAKKATDTNQTAKKKSAKNSQKARSNKSEAVLWGYEPYKEKKGEEYMTGAQPEHFKNILEAWKLQLMKEVDRTVHHMQDESANLPDPADRATQEEEFSLELRTRDRERKLIKKIEKTIKNLENEDYGYCDACGVEIGIRRLEARPTATLCIDCKTLDEIKEKQTRG
ncbi:MAG: RNA polymerase-binding protein DksA [Pseudomonadales bacterium]|nr:RNA polymerase-binding protein DksA [Pseudomonadales bacterium]